MKSKLTKLTLLLALLGAMPCLQGCSEDAPDSPLAWLPASVRWGWATVAPVNGQAATADQTTANDQTTATGTQQ